MKSYLNFKLNVIKIYSRFFLQAFFLCVTVIYPSVTYGGIFSSFLIGEVGAASMSASVMPMSLTNIPLLEAPLNPDPNILSKENDVVVLADNSLFSEIGPSGTSADMAELTSSGQISVYVVKKGDTLGEIADLFGVSVNTIIWANNMSKGGVVKEGQNLVILPVSGVRHIVKKGDTLKAIVLKYKADMDEVLQFNDLTINSSLKIGDEIIVPDVELVEYSAPVPKGTKIAGTAKYLGGSGPSIPGYYIRPVIGGVKTQGIHGWNGVDIASKIGTPIYASANGVVIVAMNNSGYNKGYGNYVVISHSNGTQTLYGHASKVLVTPGQVVAQGDLIALMGSTGKSTGSHLHFEVRGAKNPF
ncbi:MAG: M23 family metallopeptidase [bacterium]|nr:M23 family metallopeptidase [bacterium]